SITRLEGNQCCTRHGRWHQTESRNQDDLGCDLMVVPHLLLSRRFTYNAQKALLEEITCKTASLTRASPSTMSCLSQPTARSYRVKLMSAHSLPETSGLTFLLCRRRWTP